MWDCKGCKNSCCRTKKPALNKADVVRFKDKVHDISKYVIFRDDIQGRTVVGNEFSGVLTLRNNEDGNCIFLENDLCSIYEDRPTSCKLYPYNPIFREKRNSYSLRVSKDKTCKEIMNGNSFKVKENALQWREERLEYDKIVFEWNKQKNRDLVNFLRGLICP